MNDLLLPGFKELLIPDTLEKLCRVGRFLWVRQQNRMRKQNNS